MDHRSTDLVMDSYTQGALMLAVGGLAVRLGVTGTALSFVRPSHVPFLIAAGVILDILGGVHLVRALRSDMHAADDGSGHSDGPRVAWMLAAPLFAVLLIAPAPLGAFAAQRQTGSVPVQEVDPGFPPLPLVQDGAVPLGLGEFAVRARYDPSEALQGQPVRLVGFVSDTGDGDDWTLTRFRLNCCAADGTAVSVEILDGGPPPPLDQWVEVVGVLERAEDYEVGTAATALPQLRAQEVLPIDAPAEPYEF